MLLETIKNYDIVMDGCDNLYTRYIINDACVRLDKVYVYGAITRSLVVRFPYLTIMRALPIAAFSHMMKAGKQFTQPLGVLGVLLEYHRHHSDK